MLIFGGKLRIQKKHVIINAIVLLFIYYVVLKPSWGSRKTHNVANPVNCPHATTRTVVNTYDGTIDLESDDVTTVILEPAQSETTQLNYYSEGYDKALEYTLKSLALVFLLTCLIMANYSM